jgi:DNA-binding FadR family transcriptional regulator
VVNWYPLYDPTVCGTRTEGAVVKPIESTRTADGTKLAGIVAERIIEDIAVAGWPEGTVVGSESELLARHGVSRAVLREAIRLLEHLHVAHMRRGPGGGLVVLPRTADSVTDAVTVYLLYVGATIGEVFEARAALEATAAQLVPERVDEAGIEQLRALMVRERDGAEQDHRAMHRLVAKLAVNPALELVVDLLDRLMLQYLRAEGTSPTRADQRGSADAHAGVADAIIRGDGGLARARMRRHLEAEADELAQRRPPARALSDVPPAAPRSGKRAEQVAWLLLGDIVRGGWRVGALVGSEAELMARYDVSRAVLREAVRVLEHHQVARMRRGPGGGLFVAEPGADAVIQAIAWQIDRLGIEPGDLFEVRVALEMVVLESVLDHLDEAGIVTLRSALEAEPAVTAAAPAGVGDRFHGVLAGAAGNRVIELLALVLVRLNRHGGAALTDGPPTLSVDEVAAVHERIVEAVVAGDGDLARHRMTRHLDALCPRAP